MKQKLSKQSMELSKQKTVNQNEHQIASRIDDNLQFETNVKTITNNSFKTNFPPKSSSIDIRTFMQIYRKKVRSIKIQNQFRKTAALMQGNQAKQQRKGFKGKKIHFVKRIHTQQSYFNKGQIEQKQKAVNQSTQIFSQYASKKDIKQIKKESDIQSIYLSQKQLYKEEYFESYKRAISQFYQNESIESQKQDFRLVCIKNGYAKDNHTIFKQSLKQSLQGQKQVHQQQKDYLNPIISLSVPVTYNVFSSDCNQKKVTKVKKIIATNLMPRRANIIKYSECQPQISPDNIHASMQHRRHNLKPNFMYNLDLYRKKGNTGFTHKIQRKSMNQTDIDFANKTKYTDFKKTSLNFSRQKQTKMQKKACFRQTILE